MKTTLKLALGAVLSAAVVLPAIAQDNFPDVPGEHWAYDALARMKREGLLVGYPDGLFRGNRPASRYELAVAIHATYVHLLGLIEGANSQIEELKKNMGNGTDGSMREALDQLQKDVNNMKSWGDDIANLKKMASMFEKELASMGVNVDQMKQQLADLESRVGVLEKNKLPVNIHGDVNFLALGGISNSNRAFIGQDGRVYGATPAGGPAGYSQDLNIFHEAALQLSGTNEEGPKWKGTLVFANTLHDPTVPGSGVGTPGGFTGGMLVQERANDDVWIDDLSVKFDTSVGGQGFSAELGRFGYSVSPYIFMRQDTTPYYANDRWDDGKWRIDGANLGFNFGAASLNVIGGRTATINTSNGVPIQGSFPTHGGGALLGGTMMGAHLAVPITEAGKLNLAYIWNESDTALGPNFVRMETFGGDLNWNMMNSITLNGGYSQTNVKSGAAKINKDNYAWNVGAGYESDRWGVSAGWREIMPNFAAAGDWGRIGFIYNPTDIRGFMAKAHVNVSDAATINASGEWYEGTNKLLFGGGDVLTTDDEITRFTASLDYRMNESWNAMLGGEWVDVEGPTFGGLKPRMRWYNIGFGYTMSDKAKLNFMWQWADHDFKAPVLPAGLGGARSTGSLLTTQLTVKF